MKLFTASARIAISGMGDCWKIAEPSDYPSTVNDRAVLLEISGDDQNGYHLNMSPEGCFTADTWHQTKADAIETAERLFSVPKSAWRPVPHS